MTHLLTAAALYAGFVVHVALRFGAAGVWAPNLTLLVGLAAARRRGGIAWAALAGLLCDGLSGRPLGVTMLVATLVAAIARHALSADRSGTWRSAVETFMTVGLVEAAARMLAGTVVSGSSHLADLAAAGRVALTTALAAVGIRIVAGALCRVFRSTAGRRPLAGERAPMIHV